jgi:hypothetical protein
MSSATNQSFRTPRTWQKRWFAARVELGEHIERQRHILKDGSDQLSGEVLPQRTFRVFRTTKKSRRWCGVKAVLELPLSRPEGNYCD